MGPARRCLGPGAGWAAWRLARRRHRPATPHSPAKPPVPEAAGGRKGACLGPYSAAGRLLPVARARSCGVHNGSRDKRTPLLALWHSPLTSVYSLLDGVVEGLLGAFHKALTSLFSTPSRPTRRPPAGCGLRSPQSLLGQTPRRPPAPP
jgi:hypothetical protein